MQTTATYAGSEKNENGSITVSFNISNSEKGKAFVESIMNFHIITVDAKENREKEKSFKDWMRKAIAKAADATGKDRLAVRKEIIRAANIPYRTEGNGFYIMAPDTEEADALLENARWIMTKKTREKRKAKNAGQDYAAWILLKDYNDLKTQKEIEKLLRATNAYLEKIGLKKSTLTEKEIKFYVKQGEETMKEFTFTIYGTLPGLNEIIKAAAKRSGRWSEWGQMKHKNQAAVLDAIEAAKKPDELFTRPVVIECNFFLKNRKKDIDNISGGAHKIIFDALQQADIIKDDNQRYVKGHKDFFHLDPANPRIEVKVREATEKEVIE